MRVLLFTGKGGVGKTTLAAASAARLAATGRKTLVVSTDPAHSLGDVLGVPLTGDPAEVTEDGGLFAAQLDLRKLVDASWQQLRGHLRTLLSGAGLDELSATELTVLPGVEELLSLSQVYRLAETGPWEVVVVDCGPTAETLRLLALPEALAGYLERMFPAHRRVVRGLLAGLAGARQVDRWDAAADALGRLAEQLAALRGKLADPAVTSVRLVSTPERVVAAETRRTLTALAVQDIRVDGLVANRLVPAFEGNETGPAAVWLRTRRTEQEAVLAELAASANVPVRTVPHLAEEPIGVPALLNLADQLYADADPVGTQGDSAPLLSVAARGSGLASEFELRIAIPLAPDAELELARVVDELALTVDGRRRLIALPPVLRRCQVTGAEVTRNGLLVSFRPDPSVWPEAQS